MQFPQNHAESCFVVGTQGTYRATNIELSPIVLCGWPNANIHEFLGGVLTTLLTVVFFLVFIHGRRSNGFPRVIGNFYWG